MCWLITLIHIPCSHTSRNQIHTTCVEISKTAPPTGKSGPYTQKIRPHYPPKLDVGCRFNKLLGQEYVDEPCDACSKKDLYQKELAEKHGVKLPPKGGVTWSAGDVVRPFSEIAKGVNFGDAEQRRNLREEVLHMAGKSDSEPLVYGVRLEMNADVLALRQKWIEQSLLGEEPVWKPSREERRKDRVEAKRRRELGRMFEGKPHQSSASAPAPIHPVTEESKARMTGWLFALFETAGNFCLGDTK